MSISAIRSDEGGGRETEEWEQCWQKLVSRTLFCPLRVLLFRGSRSFQKERRSSRLTMILNWICLVHSQSFSDATLTTMNAECDYNANWDLSLLTDRQTESKDRTGHSSRGWEISVSRDSIPEWTERALEFLMVFVGLFRKISWIVVPTCKLFFRLSATTQDGLIKLNVWIARIFSSYCWY